MKSRSDDFQKLLKGFSDREKQDALKWIDSLTPKEIDKFEQLARLQVAQTLMQAYLKQKTVKKQSKKNILKRKG